MADRDGEHFSGSNECCVDWRGYESRTELKARVEKAEAEVERLIREVERLREERAIEGAAASEAHAEAFEARARVTRLEERMGYLMEMGQDAAHVIIECGIDHADLDRCGCEQCERVRDHMMDAGYLERRNNER